jgi:hypothetical protein
MRKQKYKAWSVFAKRYLSFDEFFIRGDGLAVEIDSIGNTSFLGFSIIIIFSTGLNDKNGNEIFESDLVKFYYKGEWVTCEVIWNQECAMYCLKWSNGYINKWYLNPSKYEVVGNIYEGIKKN